MISLQLCLLSVVRLVTLNDVQVSLNYVYTVNNKRLKKQIILFFFPLILKKNYMHKKADLTTFHSTRNYI